jgi:hypothetical protein
VPSLPITRTRGRSPGVGRVAAERDDGAVLEHHDDAEHVIERDAVLEAVRPPALVATLPPTVLTCCDAGSGA